MTIFLIAAAVLSVLLLIGLNLLTIGGRLKSTIFNRVLVGLGLAWLGISIFFPEITMQLGPVNTYFGLRWLGILLVVYGMSRWIYQKTKLVV